MSYYISLVTKITKQRAKEINGELRVEDPKLRDVISYLSNLEINDSLGIEESNISLVEELSEIASSLVESNVKEGDLISFYEYPTSLTYNYSFIFDLLGTTSKDIKSIKGLDLIDFLTDSLKVISVNLGRVEDLTEKQNEMNETFESVYATLEEETTKHLRDGLLFFESVFTEFKNQIEYVEKEDIKQLLIDLS